MSVVWRSASENERLNSCRSGDTGIITWLSAEGVIREPVVTRARWRAEERPVKVKKKKKKKKGIKIVG